MMARGPRVLVSGVVLGQGMGGVRRHNAELLPRVAALLAARGGELLVLAGETPLSVQLPAGVRVLQAPIPAGPPLARARREGREIRRVLDEERRAGRAVDLVHTAHLPAPAGLPVPFTLTLHDLRGLAPSEASLARRWLTAWVLGRALRSAALTLTVSLTVAEDLRARFPGCRVEVVPNAGDHLPVLARAPGPEAPLLALGHLEPRKNLELLLRALALDPELPDLEIVGAPKGDHAARLTRLAHGLGVGARVRLRGPVPDSELPGLYAQAAAVVVPSRLEGFGIGVLEAQRAGVPLAIAATGALPEVAGPGTPRFPPDDPAACAAAIRHALTQSQAALDEQREQAARYRWDASAEALLAAWIAALDPT